IIVDSDDSLDSNLDINDVPQEAFSLNNNLVPSIEVGKTFTSWCDVEQYIKAYAISQGFATRLDHSEKSLGIIIKADIVCHHAVVHWINNKYHVRSANLEHNHPMDTAVTLFDPGYCKLNYNEKNQIYSQQGCLQFFKSRSCDRIKSLSQIFELLTHLHNNSEYKITYSVNDNMLHCLFFATQSALTTFKYYPEIILIDATYKTNRFRMPLLLISRLDTSSTKKVVGNNVINKIQTILTNRDLAMLPAIRTELSHIKYQLCTWHIEQNIVKNLTSKLSNKFLAFSKDFKLVITETVEDQFTIRWDRRLKEYSEVNSNMEQWKSISHIMTQHSEASNAHLKRLLGHTVLLLELINITRQQCPELLKNVSIVISDFVYFLLLAQYNSATLYSVEEQGIGLFKVFNENRDHIVYRTEIELVCHCDYGLQFSLPCRHIIAVHLTCKESLGVNYIGTRWIISATDTNNVIQPKEPYDINNNENSSTTVLSSSNYDACKIQISKQSIFNSTANLIKEIEAIANRVGHVEINNCLSLFVEKLNNQYPLQQADIGDPTNIKTKERPSNTKCKKT
ncbi:18528_t:CDS:2, partial [Racocetra persica]